MKSPFRKGWFAGLLGFVLLVCVALVLSAPIIPMGSASSVVEKARMGVSLGLFATDPLWDYGELVEEIADHGAEEILVVVPFHQPNMESPGVRLVLPESTLSRTFRQVTAQGLQLTVMPMLQVAQRKHTGEWRGVLAPRSKDKWWTNYQSSLVRVADLAEQAGATRLVIGSELGSLEGDHQRWVGLIKVLRARFSHDLTYSANWDHYETVPFWRELDAVGITAYFPLGNQPTTKWRSVLTTLSVFAESVNRPLLITEYGYPAVTSASERPWDELGSQVPDPDLQAHLLDVALTTLESSDVQAHFLWNWFGFGGEKTHGFSPRGRGAAQVVQRHFQKNISK